MGLCRYVRLLTEVSMRTSRCRYDQRWNTHEYVGVGAYTATDVVRMIRCRCPLSAKGRYTLGYVEFKPLGAIGAGLTRQPDRSKATVTSYDQTVRQNAQRARSLTSTSTIDGVILERSPSAPDSIPGRTVYSVCDAEPHPETSLYMD